MTVLKLENQLRELQVAIQSGNNGDETVRRQVKVLTKDIYIRFETLQSEFRNGVISPVQWEGVLLIFKDSLDGLNAVDIPYWDSQEIKKEIARYTIKSVPEPIVIKN